MSTLIFLGSHTIITLSLMGFRRLDWPIYFWGLHGCTPSLVVQTLFFSLISFTNACDAFSQVARDIVVRLVLILTLISGERRIWL